MPVRRSGAKKKTPTRSRAVVRRRRRVQNGKGFWDFAKKASRWLRKTKLISKAGNILSTAGVPYAGKVGNIAKVLGYGKRKSCKRVVRRRRRTGKGIGLAGGALRLAGGAKKKGMMIRRRPLPISY